MFPHRAKEFVIARTNLRIYARPNGKREEAIGPSRSRFTYLENKFQTELNVAPFGSGLGQHHVNRIGSEADGACSGIDVGRLEVGVVEDVK